MLDVFSNLALGELWQLWGTLAAAALIGIGALAFAIALAPSAGARRLALEVAAVAFAFNLIYGWGAHTRDALCQAQIAQMQTRFAALQDRINTLTEAHARELEDEIAKKDADNAARLKEIAIRLKSEAGLCLPSDAELDELRRLRGHGAGG